MAQTPRESFEFSMMMVLRDGLKLCRGIRRQITEMEEKIAVQAIIQHLERSGYKFVHAPRDLYHGRPMPPTWVE